MSNHASPTTEPTGEAINTPPSNAASTRAVPLTGQAGPVIGRYSLSRGIRLAIGVSSASLAVTGIALIVLGGLGTGGAFMEGFSGLNAIVTGITLLIAGLVGLATVVMSSVAKVGRGILLVLVTTCHASGAFAFQCIIIVGKIISAHEPCLDAILAPEDMITMTTTPEPASSSCHSESIGWTLSNLILFLSIVGFVLGVVCSAVVYSGAPRLLCCLCDVHISPTPKKSTQNAQG